LKDAVAQSFSKASSSYDQWSGPQQVMAQNLMDFLLLSNEPHYIHDLGCGTGLLTQKLKKRFINAQIKGSDIAPAMVESCSKRFLQDQFICADAETLVFDPVPDLLISSAVLQWFVRPEHSLPFLFEQLKPGGVLAASIPLAGSLSELKALFSSKDWPGLELKPAEYWMSIIQSLPAVELQSEVRQFTFYYAEAREAFKSFSGIGATSRYQSDYKPMPTHLLRKALRAYLHQYSVDQNYPVSYQVLNFRVKK
jgi:malonyl-CoA O-methyltransferase